MRSSLIPSEKYSLSLSGLRFEKARTATEFWIFSWMNGLNPPASPVAATADAIGAGVADPPVAGEEGMAVAVTGATAFHGCQAAMTAPSTQATTSGRSQVGILGLRAGRVGGRSAGLWEGAAASPARSTRTRSTKAAGVLPPGSLVHWTDLNFSGTRASASPVESTTTGIRKGRLSSMSCVRSTACFHSRRKYPSRRAFVLAEISGMNSAHALIWPRIFASHASPPASSFWSNQTSQPATRSASQMLASRASTSCEA